MTPRHAHRPPSESGVVDDDPAILVLVLSHRSEPFSSLESAQRATWLRDLPPNVHVRHYQGISSGFVTLPTRIVLRLMQWTPRARTCLLRWFGVRARAHDTGPIVQVDVPDAFHLINAKTLGAFRHVLRHERFDYLYRVNSSAYVDVPLLMAHLRSLPRQSCYAGSVVRKNSTPYVLGAGIVLSRDLVERAASGEGWNYGIVDDRAFGELMQHLGIEPIDLPRVDVTSLDHARTVELGDVFLFRCKNATDRSDDPQVLALIHLRVLARRTGGVDRRAPVLPS